jgi:two-component system response regulator (stage 0 sporulation protein A)
MTGRWIFLHPVCKLVIIDDKTESTELIVDFLHDLGGYEVVGTARNGEEGIQLLRSVDVDVALIDLKMPYKDGFYVLEELGKDLAKPGCIVFSCINEEHIFRSAYDKGADYFIVKPFDFNLLAKRIDEVWGIKKKQEKIQIKQKITPEAFSLHVLHGIHISPTLSGYTYIKTALSLAINKTELLDTVTKELYPKIAKTHNVTTSQVERSMRHAIEMTWKKNGGRKYTDIIGYGNPDMPRPTVSAFIKTLVECYVSRFGSSGVM